MVEKVVNLNVTDNIDETTKSVGNLKTQLKQAVTDVQRLSDEFGASSKQATEAAKRAADLKDRIEDANDAIQAFKGEGAFTATAKALGAVSGGFTAVQGAIGLAGGESANFEKAMLKLQSAMAITQGLESIEDAGRSFKQLGVVIRSTTIFQKALSAATAVQTFVMNGATLAAKALRGALIATGVGALVVGVGLLIANFDKVKKVVMNLIPGLSAVGDVVMSIVNTVTDFIGVTSEAERANERLKTSAAASIALNKKYLAEHGSQLDEFTKQKLAAKDKYNEAIQEENADRVALAKELNRELAAIDKARQDEKDKKAKEEQDKRNEAAKKLRDEARDKAKKDAEDLANAKKQQVENTKALENEITQAIGDAQDKNAEMFMTAQEAEERAINDKYFKIKELAIQQGKDINDIEIQQMNEINDVRLTYQATKKEQDDKIKEEDIAREQAVADAKLAIQNAQIDNVAAGINLLKDLGIKNKAIQKGLLIAENAAGIAKIIINTMAGNAKAVAASPLTAGQPFVTANTIGGALGVASSIAATAKGLAALGGGGSSGGGSMPSGSSSAPTPPQFNIVGQSGTNQLAQTIAGQQNKPIEAFVVSSAVTTSQALDRNRVKTATFGG